MGVFQKVTGTGMELTHYVIESEKLPRAFSGFRVIHLSDFHCKPRKGIVSMVKKENPDVIFMTGDMVDDKLAYGSFIQLLESMLRIAPVYIVSGNHDVKRQDYSRLVDKCRKMGAVYLRNQVDFLEKDGERVIIYGIDDPLVREGEMVDDKIRKALEAFERHEGYEILLFHRSNKLKLLENEGFDLVFSGHMHGGQMRLPHLGGIVAPKSSVGGDDRLFFPEFSGGRYKLNKTDAIVSRGMGNPVPLPRFGNPTEIVSVELIRKA